VILVIPVFTSMTIPVLLHVQQDTMETPKPTPALHVTHLVLLVVMLTNVLLVQMELTYTMLNVSSHVLMDIGLMLPPTNVNCVTNIV